MTGVRAQQSGQAHGSRAGPTVEALSGRPVGELTLEAVRSGEVSLPDLRIHPATLEHQARVAPEQTTRSSPRTCAGRRSWPRWATARRWPSTRPCARPLHCGAAHHAGRLAHGPRPAPLRRPPHRGRRSLRTARPHRITARPRRLCPSAAPAPSARPRPPAVPRLHDHRQFLPYNVPYRPRSWTLPR